MLAIKKNQVNLYENITLYFAEEEKEWGKGEGNYKKTIEKATGQLEI